MTKPSYHLSVLSSERSSTSATATCHLRGVGHQVLLRRGERNTVLGRVQWRDGWQHRSRPTIRPVQGPPITITCECGEKRALRYGTRWTCERCGRTWDTNQI